MVGTNADGAPPGSHREILDGIADVARRHLKWDGPLESDMRLVEDLGLDSLQRLTLAVEVENRFRICFDEQAEARITTVADLVEAIRSELDR